MSFQWRTFCLSKFHLKLTTFILSSQLPLRVLHYLPYQSMYIRRLPAHFYSIPIRIFCMTHYHIVWLFFAYSVIYVWQSLPGHEICKRNGDLKLMSVFFKPTVTLKDKAFFFSCTFYNLLYSNQQLIAIDAFSTQNIDIE